LKNSSPKIEEATKEFWQQVREYLNGAPQINKIYAQGVGVSPGGGIDAIFKGVDAANEYKLFIDEMVAKGAGLVPLDNRNLYLEEWGSWYRTYYRSDKRSFLKSITSIDPLTRFRDALFERRRKILNGIAGDLKEGEVGIAVFDTELGLEKVLSAKRSPLQAEVIFHQSPAFGYLQRLYSDMINLETGD
jgi:hypothetical protein